MSGPTPCYLEAYPSLAAKEVVAALSNQKSKCVWFDEAGLTAGCASLLQERHHGVSVRWSLVSDRVGYITTRDGDAILTLAEGAVGANQRRLFMCPGCDSAVTRLLLASAGWACRGCHKLKYASQMEGAVAADDAVSSTLRSEVRLGKPHGQTNARRRAVVQALEQTDARQCPKAVSARWEHRVSRPQWHVAGERVEDRGENDLVLARDRFSYWEAYPCIDAAFARRAIRTGKTLCVWSTETVVIGGAQVEETEGTLEVRFALQRTAQHEGSVGAAAFEIIPTGSSDINKRWLLQCPDCKEARGALALVISRWACRACHELGYRTSMVGAPVRKAEKVANLQAQLDASIARGASKARVEQLESRLSLARAAAGPGPYPQLRLWTL